MPMQNNISFNILLIIAEGQNSKILICCTSENNLLLSDVSGRRAQLVKQSTAGLKMLPVQMIAALCLHGNTS